MARAAWSQCTLHGARRATLGIAAGPPLGIAAGPPLGRRSATAGLLLGGWTAAGRTRTSSASPSLDGGVFATSAPSSSDLGSGSGLGLGLWLGFRPMAMARIQGQGKRAGFTVQCLPHRTSCPDVLTYILTYILTYLLTYILAYILTYQQPLSSRSGSSRRRGSCAALAGDALPSRTLCQH